MPQLHIETFTLGDWMTNCYVLHLTDDAGIASPACWIIDAGFEPAPMVRYIQRQKLQPQRVILTHGHVDHIAGLHAIRAAFPGVPIDIHAQEAAFLTEPSLNLSVVLEEPVIAPAATGTLAHGQKPALGPMTFEVRHTPGHSPGGISLHQPEAGVVFVGDALFAGGVGRTDFPTSDHDALFLAIRSQLMPLPDETRVYSGHGPSTTIGRERKTNPFILHG